MTEYEYEVAVSFLGEDEAIAEQLASALREHVGDIFVYTDAQKEIAATDGVETFRRVFAEASRVVVVLYREGWGKTNWTAVEEGAIKDRGLESRWEPIVVVPLDSPAVAPKWLPKTHLWVHWERYGIDGLVPVVLRKIQEGGGDTRVETAVERAKRLAETAALAAKRKAARESEVGAAAAVSELAALFTTIAALAGQIKKLESGPRITVEQKPNSCCVARTGHATSEVRWSQPSMNSLKYSKLRVRELFGLYDLDGRTLGWPDDPVEKLAEYQFDLQPGGSDSWVWREREGSGRSFSSGDLADHLLRRLLEHTYRFISEGKEPR